MRFGNKIMAAGLLAAALLLSSCSISSLFGEAGITAPATLPPPAVTTAPSGSGGSTPEAVYSKMDLSAVDLSQYVTLDYKELELTAPTKPREITDAVIDSELNDIMIYYGHYTLDTSRRTKEGDTVEMSYAGYMNGEQFDGGTSDKATILLDDANSGYIPGFAAGLIGVMPGQTVNLELTFPENYYADMAGKPVTFKVTVKGICTCTLTDEIASKLSDGEQKTVSEYRTYLHSYLETLEDYKLLNSVYDQILTRLADKAVVKQEPDQQYLYYYQNYNSVMIQTAQAYGMDLEAYMNATGYTDADIQKMAHDNVKSDLVLYYVANAEGIPMTDEDYRGYLDNMVETYNSQGYTYTAEDIEKAFDGYYGDGYLRRQALEEAVCYKVYEYAKVTFTESGN